MGTQALTPNEVPLSADEVSAALIDVSVRKIAMSLEDQERLLRQVSTLQLAHEELRSQHADLTGKFKRVTTCR